MIAAPARNAVPARLGAGAGQPILPLHPKCRSAIRNRSFQPPHHGLRPRAVSAFRPVEFNEFVRFIRQPFPRPRADTILMREEDHLRGRTHRQQRIEQLPFPAAVGSGHGIVNDKRAGLAGPPVAPAQAALPGGAGSGRRVTQ